MHKNLLRFISISTGALAIILGLLALQSYLPQGLEPIDQLESIRDPFLNQSDRLPEPILVANAMTPAQAIPNSLPKIQSQPPQPTPQSIPRPSPQPTPLPTPVIPWMEFNEVSILNSTTVLTFQPGCDAKALTSPEFTILPWTPDIFEKGEFDIDKGTAVAWEHLGYTGLWIHSGSDWAGRPLAAQPLQNYLEKKDLWNRRSPAEFEQNAADCLIGSQVNLQVGENLLEGKVTAVLRIPAGDVETVSTHVMDLVPYLAETYPESGFDKLKAPELLLYFCGRLLTGEKPDYSIPDYSRTRIIVAIDFGT